MRIAEMTKERQNARSRLLSTTDANLQQLYEKWWGWSGYPLASRSSWFPPKIDIHHGYLSLPKASLGGITATPDDSSQNVARVRHYRRVNRLIRVIEKCLINGSSITSFNFFSQWIYFVTLVVVSTFNRIVNEPIRLRFVTMIHCETTLFAGKCNFRVHFILAVTHDC